MQAALDFFRQRSWVPVGDQPVRLFVVFAAFLALCTATGQAAAVTPLYLGAIANALAETDDSWRGRARAETVTLVFFAVAGGSAVALQAWPALFVAAVAASVFGLTMMGSLPARYTSIGFATIVFALYTMIGLDGQGQGPGHGGGAANRELSLLLAGSLANGLLAIAWSAALPAQPVQARLARLFADLGQYLGYKASLFEPLRDVDIRMKRLSLARLNAGVVAALNDAKESLLRRLRPTAPTGRLARYHGLYLIAQDVHERASSSHDDYNALADAFFHSDLLYRCQRVLMLQGDACRDLAESIARRHALAVDAAGRQAMGELRSAIAHQRGLPESSGQAPLLASIEALADNLALLDAQLAGAGTPTARMDRTDMDLSDTAPHSLREMAERVRHQLSPGSALLRHALRLAVAMGAGYALTRWLHPAQGYWIMLTTLFVCRQNYGETMARLGQRTAGTLVGVVLGWALLQLFPQPLVQAGLAVVAGVLFSCTRVRRYLLATAAITVFVLLCANQVGHGAVLIVPRLVDTAFGCLVAWLAVLLVFPHWESRRFNELAAAALRGHADYLVALAAQYREGARDDLPYRVARRQAHDADAALSTAVVDMYREPGRTRPHAGEALRFMVQAHTLLNYLSALGAHRAALPGVTAAAFAAESATAAEALREIAQRFDTGRGTAVTRVGDSIRTHELDPLSHGLSTELALVRAQTLALRDLARDWLAATSAPRGGVQG